MAFYHTIQKIICHDGTIGQFHWVHAQGVVSIDADQSFCVSGPTGSRSLHTSPPMWLITSHISRRDNIFGPVRLCVWVCGTYVVHHFNSTGLCCAPPTCRNVTQPWYWYMATTWCEIAGRNNIYKGGTYLYKTQYMRELSRFVKYVWQAITSTHQYLSSWKKLDHIKDTQFLFFFFL